MTAEAKQLNTQQTEPKMGLIERIPTAEELKAMYGHPLYDEVSPFQKDIDAQVWGEDPQTDLELIKKLRDYLLYDQLTAEQGRNLFDVAHHIARSELAFVDPKKADAVTSLLDNGYSYARPVSYHEEEPGAPRLGSHNSYHRRLGLNLKRLDIDAIALRKAAETWGMEWIDPRDAYVASFLTTAAHEAGHAVLSGIGTFGVSTYEHSRKDRSDEASRTYIQHHPEMSLTADLELDILTHEERFAEGFGRFVADKAMIALGYTEEQVDLLNRITQFPEQTDIKNGQLGYINPLTPQQIVDQISELNDNINKRQFATQMISPHYWPELVEAYREKPAAEISNQPEAAIIEDEQKIKKRAHMRALGKSLVRKVTRR